jgi:hypothetical protein
MILNMHCDGSDLEQSRRTYGPRPDGGLKHNVINLRPELTSLAQTLSFPKGISQAMSRSLMRQYS